MLDRLLKKLTQALQTSGVDLSQADISVQLDVGKGEPTLEVGPKVFSFFLFVTH